MGTLIYEESTMTAGTADSAKNRKATEPSITLTQLIRQLRKFEGERIVNAQGLALAILTGAAEDGG